MLFLVGLGGAGSKIVEGFYRKNLGGLIGRLASREEQDFKGVAIDTSQALSTLTSIPVPSRVLIGKSLTKGHGTGGDVALGRRILTEEHEFAISALAKSGFGGAGQVFLITGLGGGTGTGGFPVLAEEIKKAFDVPVFGIVTIPARSEGALYSKNASKNFSHIQTSVDGLIVVDNRGPAIRGKAGVEAYKKTNSAVRDFLRGFDINTLSKALKGDIATIGVSRAKSENTSLKELLSRLLRNHVYFSIKKFDYIYAALHGNGGKIYGERFAQEWIRNKYNAELRFTTLRLESPKHLNLYALITGITGIQERLAVDTKNKKVSSELESLLKDIKSL
jgi:cell division GTPase FtsZ